MHLEVKGLVLTYRTLEFWFQIFTKMGMLLSFVCAKGGRERKRGGGERERERER